MSNHVSVFEYSMMKCFSEDADSGNDGLIGECVVLCDLGRRKGSSGFSHKLKLISSSY